MSERGTSEKEKARTWVPPMELDPARAAPVPEEPHPGAPPDTGTLPVTAGEGRRGSRVGRWLAGALGALLVVALGFDTADLLERAFAVSVALGAVVAAAVVVAGVAAVVLLVKELRSLRRLRRIEELRGEAARLGDEAGMGEADRFAGQLGRLYEGRADLAPDLARLKDLVSDAHDDAEVVRLIDREVLAGIDRRAYQMVLRASRDTAVATALSPAALLDVVVVLWRNLRLVRDVAGLYGARPGYLGSLRLLRRMLANIAVAGVTETAHHVAVEALGGSLVAAVSTRIGQGVINGLLTARVGLTAMHLCRPVAFGPHNRPSLGRIRAELLSLPKQVL
ncbi:MAG TPA: TIGR01620 family protein [Azospirillum sp.]